MAKLLACVPALLLVTLQAPAQQRLPIIDMHLHAHAASDFGPPPLPLCVPITPHIRPMDPKKAWVFLNAKDPPCPDPIWSPRTDKELMQQTIGVMKQRNIIGVLSGTPELVAAWRAAATDRFIPALQFDLVSNRAITPDSIRRLVETGAVEVLGEIENQYVGIAPDDERMEPFWALAEELDIPVAIHMGEGAPGSPYRGTPRYRARLGSPLLLEDVLTRHPRMRVYVMHYGSPLIDEMIAVLYTHPQVYVDLGGIQWTYPRAYFYGQLKKFIDAGFGNRVMFGSDQMMWPGVIEPAIAVIEEAPFLSDEEKRDIFYNNAARFLRLSEAEIARHHGR